MGMTRRRRDLVWRIVFVVYILILIKAIVFKYPVDMMRHIAEDWTLKSIQSGLRQANFTPFRTIDMYVRYWDMGGLRSFENLVGNVIAFGPFGFILPRAWKRCRNFLICMGYGLTFVLGIELFQMFSGFGSFDVDDIILNGTGMIGGYLLYLLVSVFLKKKGCDF